MTIVIPPIFLNEKHYGKCLIAFTHTSIDFRRLEPHNRGYECDIPHSEKRQK
jgi:hypothetical protein